jgi:hypothetical protein
MVLSLLKTSISSLYYPYERVEISFIQMNIIVVNALLISQFSTSYANIKKMSQLFKYQLLISIIALQITSKSDGI